MALGYIGHRLHVLIFTQRGHAVRVISLRKANLREKRDYDQAQT
ncbi:MAG: BrnT family toxin [Alphaproteobacteria bacterium]|nr:BrnT family toxin [Alphaproteobacteria bacterium]